MGGCGRRVWIRVLLVFVNFLVAVSMLTAQVHACHARQDGMESRRMYRKFSAQGQNNSTMESLRAHWAPTFLAPLCLSREWAAPGKRGHGRLPHEVRAVVV